MSPGYIVDAHVHTGYPGLFFSPEVDAASLLRRMNQFGVQYAVNLGSMRNLLESSLGEMEKAQREFEESGERIFFCGFFDPRRGAADLAVLEKSAGFRGCKGIKIHPSFNKVAADDDRYEPAWRYAAERRLPIVSHTWSASSYNPVQVLSTPDKFERFIRSYPQVRFVLAHSGGRGDGRKEAIRLARQYDNVYMDFGGDILCQGYFETMIGEGLHERILFGSDYPWIDARTHLTRVYLADIPTPAKRRILRDNALAVYGLE